MNRCTKNWTKYNKLLGNHSQLKLHCSDTKSHKRGNSVTYGWFSGKFGAFCPEGRRFKSHSSCQVGALGKSFTPSCLLHFGMLTPTQHQSCSPNGSASEWHMLREALYKRINTIQIQYKRGVPSSETVSGWRIVTTQTALNRRNRQHYITLLSHNINYIKHSEERQSDQWCLLRPMFVTMFDILTMSSIVDLCVNSWTMTQYPLVKCLRLENMTKKHSYCTVHLNCNKNLWHEISS